MPTAATKPSWDRLFETAAAQSGYFTTQQGAEAGYSSQLLRKHVHAGRIARAIRGIYRLVHFPAAEHEELVVAWLWSERMGVLSHDTALALHELSDVLPSRVHLTLPDAWRTRRFRVPRGVLLHYGDVAKDERAWFGPVPVTTPARTLADCADAHLSPEHLEVAARQAVRRGLVTTREITKVTRALRALGARR